MKNRKSDQTEVPITTIIIITIPDNNNDDIDAITDRKRPTEDWCARRARGD